LPIDSEHAARTLTDSLSDAADLQRLLERDDDDDDFSRVKRAIHACTSLTPRERLQMELAMMRAYFLVMEKRERKANRR
jgi:hypothetical protein